MPAYTYHKVAIECAVTLLSLRQLKITIRPNEHGWCVLTGTVPVEAACAEIEGQLEGTEVKVLELDDSGSPLGTPVFHGTVRKAKIEETNTMYVVRILAVSMSYKLDQEKHSRSFQDVSMTYADVVREVVKDTPEAAAIFSVGEDRTIKKPLIQYKETDWEFFKRLASHFSSALTPDCRCGKPWFWFGMREDGAGCTFSENEYTINIVDKYYKMGEKHRGYRRSNFFYYTVRDTQNCRIGDTTVFRKTPPMICEKKAEFQRGEIIFTYKLGPKSLIGEHEYYNEQFTGLSLEGNVVKTDHELIYIHLDIDGERQGVTYPYHWKPYTGNLMYCMPKVGTRASLFMPNHDEREARATDSPRLNGSACPDMSDYNNRYLTSEHYKRMYWFPKMMGLVGTGSESTPLQVCMDDENGMLYESHLRTEIIARDCLRIEAPKVSFRVPEEMFILRTAAVSPQQESKLVPVGTGYNSPLPAVSVPPSKTPVPYDDVYNEVPATPIPVGGDVPQTALALQNKFPSESQITVYFGWDFIPYSPFDDAPQEGKPFDGWATFWQCVAGAGATLLFVGLGIGIGILTGGASLAAMAVIAGCAAAAVSAATYTVVNAAHAISTQKATDWGEFGGMLTANSVGNGIATFLTFMLPVGALQGPLGFVFGVGSGVAVDGVQTHFDNKSGEWKRLGGFDAEVDENGNLHKDFNIVDSFMQNAFWDGIFIGVGKLAGKAFDMLNIKLPKGMDELVKADLTKNNNRLQDFLVHFRPKRTINDIKNELMDSCTTSVQRRKMMDFIADHRDSFLSCLSTDQINKLLKSGHGEKLFGTEYDLFYFVERYAPKELSKGLSKDTTKKVTEQLKEAIENNDAVAQRELFEQVKEWVDLEARKESLENSYKLREGLDDFSFDYPFGEKAFLNNAISSWLPEE